MMELSDLIFYVVALSSIALGIFTVATKHILRAAVYLMSVLLLSAGAYLLLGAEFLAGAQILVYVGGIVVLLVFAVMLTRSEDLIEDRPALARKVLGGAASLAFFSSSAWLLSLSPLASDKKLEGTAPGVKELGRALLDSGSNGYVLPFEVISLLLLAVLIAGVAIARKEAAK